MASTQSISLYLCYHHEWRRPHIPLHQPNKSSIKNYHDKQTDTM